MIRIFWILYFILFSAFSFASEEVPQTFTLDGRFYADSAATVPLADVISLKIQILNPTQNCIVYEETQSVNTTTTSGYYTIQIGQKVTPPAGKRSTGDSNNGLTTVFSNSVSSMAGKLLTDGTTLCTYNPAAGDTRFVKFTMTPAGDNIPRTTTSNLRLDSVPMAIVAERAENLRGLIPNQLLQVNGTTASLTQVNLENIFSTINYPNLVSLLSTAPTNYILKNSNGSTNIPSVAGSPGSGLAAGQIWFDSVANQLKYYDGAVKVVGASATGTLAATAGGTGQSSFAIGDLLFANTTTTLARLPASTGGYVLTSNGAGTAPSWQAASSGGSLSTLTAATTTSSINNANFAQTWNWNSATTENPMTVTANALTTGSLLNLTTSSASINSTNGLLNVANSSATTNGVLARFQANSAAGSGMTILNSGNVGIGTSTPTSTLEVVGGTKPAAGNGANIILTAQSGYASGGNYNGGNINLIPGDRGGFGNRGSVNLGQPGLGAPTNIYSSLSVDGDGGESYTGTGTKNAPSNVLSLFNNTIGHSTFLDMGARNSTTDQSAYLGVVPMDGVSAPSFVVGRQTGANTYSESLRIDNSGNVGIGTTSPSDKLHIDSTTASSGAVIRTSSNQATGWSGLVTYNNNGVLGEVIAQGSSGGAPWANSFNFYTYAQATQMNLATQSNQPINFLTNEIERMRITGAGNVGIGTTSPAGTLDVDGGTVTSGTASSINLRAQNYSGGGIGGGINLYTGSGGAGNGPINLYTGSGGVNLMRNPASGSDSYAASGAFSSWPAVSLALSNSWSSAGNNSLIEFGVNNEFSLGQTAYFGATAITGASTYTPAIVWGQRSGLNTYNERMRIHSNGNVGIGTSAPSVPLDVSGTVSSMARLVSSSTVGTTMGITSSSGARSWAFGVTGSAGAAPAGSFIFFDNTAAANRVAISSTGNFGIGTTSPQTELQVLGVISPATDNTYTLGSSSYRFTNIYATGSIISTSDGRQKTEIQNSDLGLEFINNLRPVSYRWQFGEDRETHYGLIAQEIKKVVQDSHPHGPDENTPIVDYDAKSDRYGIKYTELIAPIIQAIQDLYKKLVGLETHEGSQDRNLASLQTNKAEKSDLESLKLRTQNLEFENDKLKKENEQFKARLDQIEKAIKAKGHQEHQ